MGNVARDGKSDGHDQPFAPRGSSGYPPDLLARVARLHFEFGLTHQETAKSLGLSRVKVTRLVKQARESGLVTMVVASNVGPYAELEQEMVGRFGLAEVLIVPPLTPATGACARCWPRASSGICRRFCVLK